MKLQKKIEINLEKIRAIHPCIYDDLTLIILSFYFQASKYNKTSLARYVYHRTPSWFKNLYNNALYYKWLTLTHEALAILFLKLSKIGSSNANLRL